jgi:SEC-C motif.
MPAIGRNDPCYCGSGKKYKQCCLPREEAARAEQLRLRRAVDTLLPKVIDAARAAPQVVPDALQRFWNGKYALEQIAELDDLEDRGADRFLTWLAFDYRFDDGRTLVERLTEDPAALDLSEPERQLLPQWSDVGLRAFVVDAVRKGQDIEVHDLLSEQSYAIADSAASRRLAPGDVIVGHLLPAGEKRVIGGAAAHLTPDTAGKLREFAELHLEAFRRDHPDAGFNDLLRAKSEILNHFVIALPVEAPDPSLLDQIILQTRVALHLAGESIGVVGRKGDDNDEKVEG